MYKSDENEEVYVTVSGIDNRVFICRGEMSCGHNFPVIFPPKDLELFQLAYRGAFEMVLRGHIHASYDGALPKAFVSKEVVNGYFLAKEMEYFGPRKFAGV